MRLVRVRKGRFWVLLGLVRQTSDMHRWPRDLNMTAVYRLPNPLIFLEIFDEEGHVMAEIVVDGVTRSWCTTNAGHGFWDKVIGHGGEQLQWKTVGRPILWSTRDTDSDKKLPSRLVKMSISWSGMVLADTSFDNWLHMFVSMIGIFWEKLNFDCSREPRFYLYCSFLSLSSSVSTILKVEVPKWQGPCSIALDGMRRWQHLKGIGIWNMLRSYEYLHEMWVQWLKLGHRFACVMKTSNTEFARPRHPKRSKDGSNAS